MRVKGKAGAKSLDEMIELALEPSEPLQEPKAEPPRPQSLLEKVILSKWTAPLSAAALGGYFYRAASLIEGLDFSGKLTAPVIIAGLGYLTATLMRQDWLSGKAESAQRKSRALPSKILGFLGDSPGKVALGLAGYATAVSVSPMFVSIGTSDFFRHPKVLPVALDLSAYVFSAAFVASYPAVSLAFGRVVHPEFGKTIFNATAAVFHAYRGRHQEAENDLARLLELQRGYKKTVALQTLIGDFRLLSDDLSCFNVYTDALATEKTSHAGRSDWLLNFFIGPLNDIVMNAKKPEWAEAEDLAYICAAAHALSEGRVAAADTLLQSAVRKEKYSLAAHQARAALLRRTGRHSAADLEMMVVADLLMLQKTLDAEKIDGGRNRVLRKGRTALKLNKDVRPLRDERDITETFRSGFGPELVYPLPIYQRGSDYMLLSEMDVSETLLDSIKKRRARIVDFAMAMNLNARVQKFGLDLYKQKKLALDESILCIDFSKPAASYFANRRRQAIQQVERHNDVKFPKSLKLALISRLLFVDRAMASYPHLTMDKDNNPGNVLKRPSGMMQLLDFEGKSLRLLPPQTSAVCLLEFMPYLTREQKQWLLKKAMDDFEDLNHVRLDRGLYLITYEMAGLQWNFERLIYRPGEAARATDTAIREEKMKQQVRHWLAEARHLDAIIDGHFVTGAELDDAKRAREAMDFPLFAQKQEYDRLCRIVEKEERELLLREPLPTDKKRLALASAGAAIVLGAATLGAVSVKNNLVPVVNVPVFPQGDKILLAVSSLKEVGGFKREVPGPGSVDYFVIDAKTGKLVFLTKADSARSSDLSAFQDKAVFIRDGLITLYDFVEKEFRAVKDARFENPQISPNGLWIAANINYEHLAQSAREIWLIRPDDMKTRQTVKIPNSFSPAWSSDGSYIAFLSNNAPISQGGRRIPDTVNVWLNTLNVNSGEINAGPLVSYRGRITGIAEWSGKGSLAYLVERQGEQQQIHISDGQFNSTMLIYVAGNRDLLGFSNESISAFAFVGTSHLAIQSALSNQSSGLKFSVSLLDLNSMELKVLATPGFMGGVSKDGSSILYTCGEPSDLCEFNVKTGQTKVLTNTPGIRESSAVYSPRGDKVYVVAYPALNCARESCPPSLFAIDLAGGRSSLLREETNGNLRYELVPP